jgi:hypothetical protein
MRRLFQWVKDNPNRAMFLVPILLVAGISISHVVSWYDIANPINWAIYLSIAIEVAAMTALVAATNRIKGGVWFMFILVTIIQMIGNIFFSFKEIDANGDLFKSWMELTGPLWEMLGSDPTDISSQKRWLAFLEGGLLPIISLTSLHFFTKYNRNVPEEKEEVIVDTPEISKPDEDITNEQYEQILKDFVKKQKEEAEKIKYTPNEEDLRKLDEFLSKIGYDGPKKVETDESIKFTPNEDELKKMEDILKKYPSPENVEIENIEEDVITNEVIDENQIIEKNFEENEIENLIIEEEIEVQEIKPEPVEIKTNKVLNYFK